MIKYLNELIENKDLDNDISIIIKDQNNNKTFINNFKLILNEFNNINNNKYSICIDSNNKLLSIDITNINSDLILSINIVNIDISLLIHDLITLNLNKEFIYNFYFI